MTMPSSMSWMEEGRGEALARRNTSPSEYLAKKRKALKAKEDAEKAEMEILQKKKELAHAKHLEALEEKRRLEERQRLEEKQMLDEKQRLERQRLMERQLLEERQRLEEREALSTFGKRDSLHNGTRMVDRPLPGVETGYRSRREHDCLRRDERMTSSRSRSPRHSRMTHPSKTSKMRDSSSSLGSSIARTRETGEHRYRLEEEKRSPKFREDSRDSQDSRKSRPSLPRTRGKDQRPTSSRMAPTERGRRPHHIQHHPSMGAPTHDWKGRSDRDDYNRHEYDDSRGYWDDRDRMKASSVADQHGRPDYSSWGNRDKQRGWNHSKQHHSPYRRYDDNRDWGYGDRYQDPRGGSGKGWKESYSNKNDYDRNGGSDSRKRHANNLDWTHSPPQDRKMHRPVSTRTTEPVILKDNRQKDLEDRLAKSQQENVGLKQKLKDLPLHKEEKSSYRESLEYFIPLFESVSLANADEWDELCDEYLKKLKRYKSVLDDSGKSQEEKEPLLELANGCCQSICDNMRKKREQSHLTVSTIGKDLGEDDTKKAEKEDVDSADDDGADEKEQAAILAEDDMEEADEEVTAEPEGADANEDELPDWDEDTHS